MESSNMASGTYFIRSCPTCGRHLEIRVELLNRDVECTHCGANFTASDSVNSMMPDWRIEQALARTQEFLASVTSNSAAGEMR